MSGLTIKSGLDRYPEVSFLRGYAITTVILMHLLQVFVLDGNIPGWLRTVSSVGGTGGHMFVFCSGFGLYLSYLRQPLGLGVFIRKRFLRVYLPYIIIVILSWGSVWYWSGVNMWKPLLSHIFLYKMFFESYEISFGLHFWFMSTIFQLYLLFLPLCRIRRAVGMKKLLLISLVISMGWWILTREAGVDEQRIWGSFCLQYLWEFVLGMAIAERIRDGEMHLKLTWLIASALIGLGLQAVTAIDGGWWSAFNDIPGFFGYGAVALLLYTYAKKLIRPIFLRIDPISYEWFLVHILVFSNFYGIVGAITKNEILLALGAVICSLILARLYAAFLHLLRIK